MANRLVFLPTAPSESSLYKERLVSFEWVPGMAISQGTKSVINLHRAAKEQLEIEEILEISTRSQEELGVRLSAFNLPLDIDGLKVSVEVAYQSSKIFENGGPFLDLLNGSSLEAKQDSRLKDSGALIGFKFEGVTWPLSPTPNFYDYLYIRGLLDSPFADKILDINAFTDIAFSQSTIEPNVKKSFNCQARSAAIYVSLLQRMNRDEISKYLLSEAAKSVQKSEQLGLF
jgi:hypothetical protein